MRHFIIFTLINENGAFKGLVYKGEATSFPSLAEAEKVVKAAKGDLNFIITGISEVTEAEKNNF